MALAEFGGVGAISLDAALVVRAAQPHPTAGDALEQVVAVLRVEEGLLRQSASIELEGLLRLVGNGVVGKGWRRKGKHGKAENGAHWKLRRDGRATLCEAAAPLNVLFARGLC